MSEAPFDGGLRDAFAQDVASKLNDAVAGLNALFAAPAIDCRALSIAITNVETAALWLQASTRKPVPPT